MSASRWRRYDGNKYGELLKLRHPRRSPVLGDHRLVKRRTWPCSRPTISITRRAEHHLADNRLLAHGLADIFVGTNMSNDNDGIDIVVSFLAPLVWAVAILWFLLEIHWIRVALERIVKP